MKNRIIINIGASADHFGAYDENEIGIYGAGNSIVEVKQDVLRAIDLIKNEFSDQIPDILKRDYEIVYKYDIPSLLAYFDGIFTKRGLSKITGVNEDLLYQYSVGLKKPGPNQKKKIEMALHRLGKDLMAVEL